ncbi:MAG: V-type ATP synthase subunit D [Clostridia bacterium]|nr:V-type ATP synthase subunit D [Clostridia bacterium]
MNMQISPTRMELKKLQARCATARRGHKLLKDKCDGLMQQFLEVVREARVLRAEVEKRLGEVYAAFDAAAATGNPKMLQEAFLLSKNTMEGVEVSYKNRMGVCVPQLAWKQLREQESDGICYGFAFTSGELDRAVLALSDLREPMMQMAELEKQAMLLAGEIERTRRRVNALEHIMIPQYLSAIRSIRLKLDENERGNITRLMKVKDMMLQARMQKQKDFIPDEEEMA